MQYIYYPKCSTCIKGLKYLKDNGIDVTFRDIVNETPSKEELYQWILTYNQGIKPFFNTSGKLYREMNLKEQIAHMSIEEASELLCNHGLFIKRPLLIDEERIFIGFKGAYDL